MMYSYLFILSVPVRNVEAVLGGIAELPCDVTPEDVHDDVYLILWFRDEASKPMYRYTGSHTFDNIKSELYIYKPILFQLLS